MGSVSCGGYLTDLETNPKVAYVVVCLNDHEIQIKFLTYLAKNGVEMTVRALKKCIHG